MSNQVQRDTHRARGPASRHITSPLGTCVAERGGHLMSGRCPTSVPTVLSSSHPLILFLSLFLSHSLFVFSLSLSPSHVLSLSHYLSHTLSLSLTLFSHSLTLSLIFPLTLSLTHSLSHLLSLTLFLSLGQNDGPRTGSRQRHHSTAMGSLLSVNMVQKLTQIHFRQLPAPRPSVSGPIPAVGLATWPVPQRPYFIRRLFIRRLCEIGFGI